jgi:hypothetical protein
MGNKFVDNFPGTLSFLRVTELTLPRLDGFCLNATLSFKTFKIKEH